MDELYAGLEAGGTKMVVGVAERDGTLRSRETVPTTTPEETIAAIRALLLRVLPDRRFASLGIGTFGPAQTLPSRPDYGRITVTPKPGWSGTDLLGPLSDLAERTAFDTDVNAAGLAEATAWGRSGTLAYVTVGTGIGFGVIADGEALAGASHYEGGHVPLPRAPGDDVVSTCPFHDDCAEGLAAGPAWKARYGTSLSDLPSDHEGRRLAASYLGGFCRTLLVTHSPERIVLGGGVMKTPGLIDAVREETERQIGGYGAYGLPGAYEIVPPVLGDDAGLRGAILLGQRRTA